MQFFASTCPTRSCGTIAVVGSWDPLASCHFSLWDRLAAEAASRSLRPLVATIAPLPQAILRGRQSWPDTDDLSFIKFVQRLCGIDSRIVVSLEQEDLKDCTRTLVSYLKHNHDLRELWLGRNQSFGSGPLDSRQCLRDICDELEVSVVMLPITASRIPAPAVRRALAAGKVGQAARLLGRPIFRATQNDLTVNAPWQRGLYRGQLCSPDDFEFVRNGVSELSVVLTGSVADVWVDDSCLEANREVEHDQWIALTEDQHAT